MVEKTEKAPAGEPAKETAAADSPVPAKVSLKRFCTELSLTDRRVELIGGFEHSERVKGRVLDTSEAYQQRYEDFAKATPK